MATPDGRVAFESGGRGRVLQFTTNRFCLLEDKIGKTPLEIAVELEMNPRISTIRAMMWAGLGEGDMTLNAAGDVIDQVGRTEAIDMVREAFMAAFPPKDESTGDGKGGGENPPVAAAG